MLIVYLILVENVLIDCYYYYYFVVVIIVIIDYY